MHQEVVMKKTIAAFIAFAALVVGLAIAQDAEKKITMKDLPPAVQAAVKEHSQGATIKGLAMEVEKGKKLYEAELSVNGKSRDITFDEQGKLMSSEEEIALNAIPEAARAAMTKAAGAGKITLVEAVTENGTTTYEAHVTTGKKQSEIKVDAGGQAVK
jgi:uncharacterized membrane protein YkoI